MTASASWPVALLGMAQYYVTCTPLLTYMVHSNTQELCENQKMLCMTLRYKRVLYIDRNVRPKDSDWYRDSSIQKR